MRATPMTAGSSRHLIGLAAAAILLPALLFGIVAVLDYQSAVRRAGNRLEQTADLFHEHARKVFETETLVLSLLDERTAGRSETDLGASETLHNFLSGLVSRMPQTESIFLTGPTGTILSSSRAFPMTDYNVADREYFQLLRDKPGLIVSTPFAGRYAGTTAFTIGRRRGGDGFDGIMQITISPAYFKEFYLSAIRRAGLDVTLLRDDGTVLVSYAGTVKEGSSLTGAPAVVQTTDGGIADVIGPDGTRGYYIARKLEGWPLTLLVGSRHSVALSEWQRSLMLVGGFVGFAILALAGFALSTVRRAARERAVHLRLAEETTQRAAAEEALLQAQKTEAIGRLTGGVAHDFNNLLAAIVTSLELARAHVSGDKVRGLLDTALQSAERGATLTQRLLAFARKQHLQPEPTDVNALVEGMASLLRPVRAAGITFDLDPVLRPVLADPGQLELALLNLVFNARDATAPDGRIAIATRNVAIAAADPSGLPDGDYVGLAVQDEGTGMSAEVAARAFEPFFTTKDPGKGSGLGLSQVYGFAQQSGGTVLLDSAPGRGTRVEILLPRSLAAPAAKPPPTSASPHVPKEIATILLVDDEALIREALAALLEDRGHLVVTAGSGPEALAAAEGMAELDLLVADYRMPGMTGLELANALRETRPGLPVVIASGYTALEGAGLPEGMLFLHKPFREADLFERLHDALAHPPKLAAPHSPGATQPTA